MKPIRAVIVDDELLARENMRDLLQIHPEVAIVGEAATVQQAREVLKNVKPDAVFLDIQIPGGTGFDVLAGLDLPLQVVFVTAYDAYAVRAFQVNAVDYLLKPIDRELLANAVQKLTALYSQGLGDPLEDNAPSLPFRLSDDLLVQEKGKCCLVPIKSIYAIRADRNYTEVLAAPNQAHLFRHNLKSWHARLPAPPFLRLDRSLIINTEQVTGWKSSDRWIEVQFENGAASLVIGRAAAERFREGLVNKRSTPSQGPTSGGQTKRSW
jgi:two-component system, LytTR family, response regulator